MIAAVALLVYTTTSPANVESGTVEIVRDPSVEVPEPWLSASAAASEGYRFRTTGTEHDNDAQLTLAADADAFNGRASFAFSGALFWDLDASAATAEEPQVQRAFPSVHDAYGPVALFVDTLELRGAWPRLLPRASVGRLTVDEGQPLTLDGAAVRVTPYADGDFAVSLFSSAGRTVHFFTLDDTLAEDFTAGVGGDITFARALKLEVDWRGLLEDAASARSESTYGAAFTCAAFDDTLLAKAFARGIDASLASFGARVHYVSPWSFGVDAQAIGQTATLGEVFELDNPFFAVLGPSEPNVRGNVDVWARAKPSFVDVDAGVHVGAGGRSVLAGEAGPFNRDFGRVYASVDAADIVVKGPFANAIVSYDAAVPRAAGQRFDGVDPAVVAVGGSVGWMSEIVRASVGTSWDRTRYTYYRDVEELTDVRTVFADVQWHPLNALRVKAGYSLELADRTVHTFALTLVEDVGGAL